MGYLIVRIEPWENERKHWRDCESVVEKWATRHALRDPLPAHLRDVLARRGYERAPRGGFKAEHYPYIAYCYTCRHRDGKGRCGSSLWRVRVRKREG